MPQTKQKPQGLTVIKGDLPALTLQQRELVRIFVWYLRTLPEWNDDDDDSSWDSAEYEIVGDLVTRFFKDRNPNWKARPGEERLTIDDLPESDQNKLEDLMWFAGSADTDPIISRRQGVAKVAREKRALVKLAERYNKSREELGLPPDASISVSKTPIEIAAEKTWGIS